MLYRRFKDLIKLELVVMIHHSINIKYLFVYLLLLLVLFDRSPLVFQHACDVSYSIITDREAHHNNTTKCLNKFVIYNKNLILFIISIFVIVILILIVILFVIVYY